MKPRGPRLTETERLLSAERKRLRQVYYDAARRARFKAAGSCIGCASASPRGTKYCTPCGQKNAARQRKYHLAKKLAKAQLAQPSRAA